MEIYFLLLSIHHCLQSIVCNLLLVHFGVDRLFLGSRICDKLLELMLLNKVNASVGFKIIY